MKKIWWILLLIFTSTVQAQEIELNNTSINTEYAEFGVSYLNNSSILFASSKKTDDDKTFTKKRRQQNKQLHLELYIGDIIENGDVIQRSKFSKNVNNPILESDISFSPDKKTVYFTWNNFYNTQKRKDSAKWKTLQIVKASINEQLDITNIQPLPFNSNQYSVRNPEVSKDGKQLFFVSNMPGNYGGNDIYVVDILANNTYSKPKNLGPTINTKESEFFPFVDANNNLYFSTSGHKGLGQLDIFKSEYKNGEYQIPIGLKAPFNSKFDDFGFVENSLGTAGYITSNRKESRGGVDVFSWNVKEKKCFSELFLSLINQETQLDIKDVLVTIFKNNDTLNNTNSTYNSTKSIVLKCNSTYKISIEKEGFYKKEITFNTTGIEETISKNVILTPIECTQSIAGNILHKDTQQPILNAKVSLFIDNELVSSKFAETTHEFQFNVKCDSNYKIVVEKEQFEIAEVNLTTDKTLNKSNVINLHLTPIECTQSIAGNILHKDTQQPILNAKVSLFIDNELVSSKFTETTHEFQFNVKCDSNYKILVEKEQFEIAEVNLKTDKTLSKTNTLNLHLTPIECTQSIAGIILHKDTQQPILNAKVSLFIDNELIESQYTTNKKGYLFQVNCNTNTKIAVSKSSFISVEYPIATTSINKNKIIKDIVLASIIEVSPITNLKSIKTNAIYFDLDSDEISAEAAIELNKVVGVLKSYPTLKIEVQSHTDSRAPDAYNLALSQKRAAAAAKYIVSQGIDNENVLEKGYGETKLLNKCKNGVPCTNAEHELNRRTEFVIIKE